MKLYINGGFAQDLLTGVGKYCISVLQELDLILQKRNEYAQLVLPQGIKFPIVFNNIKITRVGFFSGNLWEEIELPFYTRDGYLINLGGKAPIFKRKQALLIHDVAIYTTPERFSKKFCCLLKYMYSHLGEKLTLIFTNSEYSKSEISKYIKINSKKIYVAYAGHEQLNNIIPDNRILKREHLKSKKFLLAVGGTDNKNFDIIAKGFEYLKLKDINLVVTGKYDSILKKKIHNYSSIRIKPVGYVSNEELVCLYQNAICLVFPSTYEGFGMPTLEAMFFGCPVVVSNIPPLVEVCGDAALYCDPYDAEDVAAKMSQIICNYELANSLRYRGENRIKLFSWETTAEIIYTYVKADIINNGFK